MTRRTPFRCGALLAALAALAFGPAEAGAQEAAPLVKSEVVRLLVSDTYGPEERRQIVRRSCLTFVPSEEDMEDFRRLGAGPELLEVIRQCSRRERSSGGGVQVPEPPGDVAVSVPAVRTPSDTGWASELFEPTFDPGLRAYAARPSPPGPDRGNLLDRVDVPPRLQNPAEVQRMLRRSAPDTVSGGDGVARSVLWVFVTPEGTVREARIGRSSGIAAFDRAALEVARSMRFSPGTTGSRPVGMWVQQTLAVGRRGG